MMTAIVGSTLFLDNSDHLEHHGVKGMKWGVRRYTDKNGNLTEKGRAKLEKKVGKLRKKQAKAEKAGKRIAAQRKGSAALGAIFGAVSGALMLSPVGPAAIAGGAAVVGALGGFAGAWQNDQYADYAYGEGRRAANKAKAYEELLNS